MFSKGRSAFSWSTPLLLEVEDIALLISEVLLPVTALFACLLFGINIFGLYGLAEIWLFCFAEVLELPCLASSMVAST